MGSVNDTYLSKIIDSINEIKDICQDINLGLNFCRQEIDAIKNSKKVCTKGIRDKLDKMIVSMSNLN